MTRLSAPTPSGIPTPTKVVASGAVILAMTTACVAGLDGLILPGPWRWTVVAILTAVTGVIVAARLALRRRFGPDVSTLASLTPSLAGLVTAVLLLAARFGRSAPRGTSGDLDLSVSLENFRGLARLARTIEEIAVTTIAPITPLEAIVALFTAGACLVLVLMDMFVAVRVPALAGLATSLLWLPTLMIVGDVPAWSVITVTGLLLVLLAVDRPTGATSQTGRPTARETAIPVASAGLTITAVVAVGLAVSLALPSLPWRGVVAAPDLRTGVANLTDDLDLRRSLQEQSTREVLTYTVSEGAPPVGPLRTTSLVNFDGQHWQPSDSAGEPARAGDLLWPSLAEGSSATSFALRMQFEGLASSTVPVPLEPRMITSNRQMSYDPERDAVDVANRLSSGDSLEMTVMPRDLDPARLRSRNTLEPLDQSLSGPFVDPDRTAPATSHSADVAQLARSVVGTADNRYDAAVALQDFLRTSPDFNYSLSVPAPTSDDAVWDFLQDGTGYCVQFASAMTIMARTLGIPARMSIGYLPGTVGSDGVAVVRGRDAHAWPEIYFDDVGWVRFEPTPALQSGALPGYAATATATSTPTATKTPTPTATSQRPTRSATTGPTRTTATATTSSSTSAPGALVASLVLVLVAAAGVTVMLLRRRASRVRVRDVEEAWSTIVRAARKGGLEVDPAATVRSTAARVAPDGEAVAEVGRRVEVARYAPAPRATDRDELEGLVRAALAEVAARLAALAGSEDGGDDASAAEERSRGAGSSDRGEPR